MEQGADEGGALVGLSGWGWGSGARHAFARRQLFASAIGVTSAAAVPGSSKSHAADAGGVYTVERA
jgi:hypothetical protein